MIPAQGER